MEDKRIETIDILRGIATISVLLGHSIQRGMVIGYENNILFKIIYTYHMPLFMLLAGYTLYLSNPKYDISFLMKKFNRLIVPTIIWSYLLFLVKDVKFTGLKPFVKFPDDIFSYTKLLIKSPDFVVWFLYVVFVCTVIVFIGKRLFDKQIFVYFIAVSILINSLPINALGIGRTKLYLPIFLFGYCIAMYKEVYFEYIKYMLIPSIVFYIFMFNRWSFLSSKIYQWSIAFAGITIIYYLVKHVRIKTIDDILSFLGKYSLEIYLAQALCLNIGIGSGLLKIVSIFITATTISVIISYLSKFNKYSNSILYGNFIRSFRE